MDIDWDSLVWITIIIVFIGGLTVGNYLHERTELERERIYIENGYVKQDTSWVKVSK